jgi:hypothetical protein
MDWKAARTTALDTAIFALGLSLIVFAAWLQLR